MDDDGTEPNHPPCETNNNKHHKCLTGKKYFNVQYTLTSIQLMKTLSEKGCAHTYREAREAQKVNLKALGKWKLVKRNIQF